MAIDGLIAEFDLASTAGDELSRHSSLYGNSLHEHSAAWIRLHFVLFSSLVELSACVEEFMKGETGLREHKQDDLESRIAGDIRKALHIWQKTTKPVYKIDPRSNLRAQSRDRSFFTGVLISVLETAHMRDLTSNGNIPDDAMRFLRDRRLVAISNDFEQIASLSVLLREEYNLASHEIVDPGTVLEGLLNLLIPVRLLQLATASSVRIRDLLLEHQSLFDDLENFRVIRKSLQGYSEEIASLVSNIREGVSLVGVRDVLLRLSDVTYEKPKTSGLTQFEAGSANSSGDLQELRQYFGNLVMLISKNAEDYCERVDKALSATLDGVSGIVSDSADSILERIDSLSNGSIQSHQAFNCELANSDVDGSGGASAATSARGLALAPSISEDQAIAELNRLKHEIVRNAQAHFNSNAGVRAELARPVMLYHCICYEALSRALISNGVRDIDSPEARALFERMIISRNPSYQDVVEWQIAHYRVLVNKILESVAQTSPPLWSEPGDGDIPF